MKRKPKSKEKIFKMMADQEDDAFRVVDDDIPKGDAVSFVTRYSDNHVTHSDANNYRDQQQQYQQHNSNQNQNQNYYNMIHDDGSSSSLSLPPSSATGLERRPQTGIYNNTNRARYLRIAVGSLLFGCILYVIVDSCTNKHIETRLLQFLEWTHLHPYQGILAIIVCYSVATVCFVPGSILTFGAGYAIGSSISSSHPGFGILLATASVFIGASIGSIVSFLLGRYLFRNCVLQLASTYPLFQAIDIALSENGLKIMVLLRLSPLIPFNALDYISGITSISLRDYTLALMAILPGAFVLCFAGASASSFTPAASNSNNKDDDNSSSTVKIITIVTGLLFGGAGVYLGSYYSKMELDRILAGQEASVVASQQPEEEQ